MFIGFPTTGEPPPTQILLNHPPQIPPPLSPHQLLLPGKIINTDYNNIFKNKDVRIIYKIIQINQDFSEHKS